jgi:hypothetical protein
VRIAATVVRPALPAGTISQREDCKEVMRTSVVMLETVAGEVRSGNHGW